MTDPKRARCLDKDWKFNKETDLKKLFKRIRREQKAAAQVPHKVESIQRAKRKTAP